MLIRRLQSVDDFRIFDKWQDQESRKPHVFGRQTLIFGPNGSGKSTLADIAWAVNRRQKGYDYDSRLDGVQLEVCEDGGNTTVPASSDKVPPVYVFGSNYIEANLRKAFEEGAEGAALYVLGQKDSDLEHQIEGAEHEQEAASEDLTEVRSREKEWQAQLDSVLETVKADVAENLQSYDPSRYNTTPFNKTKARALLGGSRKSLDPDQLAEARRNLELTEASLPSELDFTPPTFPQSLIDSADEAASYNVTSQVIEALANNSQLAKWVREGLFLHGDATHCGFCSQPLPTGHLAKLEAHFDATYRELMQKLDRLEDDVARQHRAIEDAMERARNLPQASEEIAAVMEEKEADLEVYWQQAGQWIDGVKSMIDARRSAPHRPYASTLPCPPEPTPWREVEQSVRSFNEAVRDKRNSVAQYRKQGEDAILSHIAAKHGESFDESVQYLERTTAEKQETEQKLAEVEDRLRQLRARRADEHDGEALAQRLTEDLIAYLGHSELSVEFVKDEARAGFEFRRRGRPARFLSEGERNAIALLHFLRSLETTDVNRHLADACIVIDDPVSSLDQDAILSAFTFLLSRLRDEAGSLKCKQLIILTHNFEFFRLWKDVLHNPIDKDTKEASQAGIDVWKLRHRRAAIIELLMRVDLKHVEPQRMPLLRDFSVGIGALTSEYYYLFARACESTFTDGEELLPLTGNSTRRLLESFLKFKLPEELHFVNAARRLGRNAQMDRATIDRVVRALHRASHRSEIDIHTPAYRSQIVNEIMSALRFIEQVDSLHFEGMCKATGKRPSYVEYEES